MVPSLQPNWAAPVLSPCCIYAHITQPWSWRQSCTKYSCDQDIANTGCYNVYETYYYCMLYSSWLCVYTSCWSHTVTILLYTSVLLGMICAIYRIPNVLLAVVVLCVKACGLFSWNLVCSSHGCHVTVFRIDKGMCVEVIIVGTGAWWLYNKVRCAEGHHN